MDLFVSVCVCVCACLSVTFVHTGRTLVKIKNVNKIACVDFDIYHRLASLKKNVLCDLDLLFRFQKSKICEFRLFLYVTGKLNYEKSAIHIHTFAIEWHNTLTYIFDFKCLKYVKFVRFRMLPEAKIMGKKISNKHSNICHRTP